MASKDVMREKFTPVSEDNKMLAAKVKSAMNEVHALLEACPQGRCMAIAKTHLETASMFAVKEITAPEHNEDATSS